MVAKQAQLIAVEGPDGVGKDTLIEMLSTVLTTETGRTWRTTTDPSQERIGKLIREILRGPVQDELEALGYLFLADRLAYFPPAEVMPYCLSSRYLLSTAIYQRQVLGESATIATLLNRKLRRPALTLILLASPQTCMGRLAKRDPNKGSEVFERRSTVEDACRDYREVALGSGNWAWLLEHQEQVLGRQVLSLDTDGLSPDEVLDAAIAQLRPWVK